jgi:hypothetical protein
MRWRAHYSRGPCADKQASLDPRNFHAD